jgi:hypothetical protein
VIRYCKASNSRETYCLLIDLYLFEQWRPINAIELRRSNKNSTYFRGNGDLQQDEMIAPHNFVLWAC